MDDKKLCVNCFHHRKSSEFRWSAEQERCHVNPDLIDIVTGEVLEPMSKSCYDMRYETEKTSFLGRPMWNRRNIIQEERVMKEQIKQIRQACDKLEAEGYATIPHGVLQAINNAGFTLIRTIDRYELKKLEPAYAQSAQETPWARDDLDAMVCALESVIVARECTSNTFIDPMVRDARTAIRFLKGYLPAMKKMQEYQNSWKPIETAPRDNSRVLVWIDDENGTKTHAFAKVWFTAMENSVVEPKVSMENGT